MDVKDREALDRVDRVRDVVKMCDDAGRAFDNRKLFYVGPCQLVRLVSLSAREQEKSDGLRIEIK